MVQVNKYVKIGIVAVVIIVALLISFGVSQVINDNSYDIEDISGWVEETTQPTKPVNAEDAMWEDVPQAVKDLYSMKQGDLTDAEFAVNCSLVMLKYSPLSGDVESSSYEVKLQDGYWVTKFKCKNYSVFVSCDSTYFQPVVFTFSRKLSDAEREYFLTLGNATEVNNEDGTYTIYYI